MFCSTHIQEGSTGEHPKKEMEDQPVKLNHDTDMHQTPQRSSQNVFGSASSQNVLSRITGDVSLTPTNLHTPLYSNANPHNTMTAMTPASSGCNQAKNSIKIQ